MMVLSVNLNVMEMKIDWNSVNLTIVTPVLMMVVLLGLLAVSDAMTRPVAKRMLSLGSTPFQLKGPQCLPKR